MAWRGCSRIIQPSSTRSWPLNEGAGGQWRGGKPYLVGVQVSEKFPRNYDLKPSILVATARSRAATTPFTSWPPRWTDSAASNFRFA